MKRLALVLLLSAAACGGARGQAPAGDAAEEKWRDLVRLLELSRGAELGKQIISQSIKELQEGLTFLTGETRGKIIKIFEEEMLKEFSKEKIFELVLPIYDKHLAAEDVKALIAFYETPVGKKMLDVQPLIMREAYEVGSERGREAGRRAMARIAEAGLLPTPVTAQTEKPAAPAPAKQRAPRKKGH